MTYINNYLSFFSSRNPRGYDFLYYVIKRMSVKFEKKYQYYIDEVFTYGVCNGKYGGYSIPLKVSDSIVIELERLAKKHNATHKMYGDGNTLYLRCDQLTQKQREELLGKGKMIVEVEFIVSGTHKTQDGNRLSISITKLRKVKKALNPPPTD